MNSDILEILSSEARQIELEGASCVLLSKAANTRHGSESFSFLSAHEIKRMASMSESRKVEFLLGRASAAILLKNKGYPQLTLSPGKEKHSLVAGPNSHFVSISHDRYFAGALVANDGSAVGLDIQDYRSLRQNIVSRICSESEQKRLKLQNPISQIAIFSAKEAVFKALVSLGLAVKQWIEIECLEFDQARSSFLIHPPEQHLPMFLICKQIALHQSQSSSDTSAASILSYVCT